MDAASITAIRTAAVSGVATRLLARKDARVLAILGAGVQARSHLDAMMAVRPFSTVRVWSRTRAHAQAIADRAVATYGVEASVSSDAAGAVRGANVICTVTASREPVLCGEWLDAGAHVNAVGASLPTTRELDTEAVRRARIVVDRRESALNEAGDILIPMREGAIDAGSIVAELGELIIGARRARQSEREITLCKSLGIAVEDLACAHDLRLRAIDTGRGTWIEL
jgi:ornithine cyclodeaminase